MWAHQPSVLYQRNGTSWSVWEIGQYGNVGKIGNSGLMGQIRHIGHIGYTGQVGLDMYLCHMGDFEYFGQRNVPACHSSNAVPLLGDILLVRTPNKGIMRLSTSEVTFIIIWSVYAFVTKGEGVMLRCDDVLAHSL